MMGDDELDGPFYIENCEDGWEVLITESEGAEMIVFDRLREEKAIEFCDRLNNAVMRYIVEDRDPE